MIYKLKNSKYCFTLRHYKGKYQNLAGKGGANSPAYNFKMYNTGAENFSLVIMALKELYGCDYSIAIPPHTVNQSNIQKVCDLNIITTFERSPAHKGYDVKIDIERERCIFPSRLSRQKILLFDDICTTGNQMKIYYKLLMERGAKEIVRFALEVTNKIKIYPTETLIAIPNHITEKSENKVALNTDDYINITSNLYL